jgi:glycosyltransferase involved in cell wall biosynthesis
MEPAGQVGANGRGTETGAVAYVVSRFPKLTETFVLYEILALERRGVRIELFPLLQARNTAVHAEGAGLGRKIIERLRRSTSSPLMHAEAAPLVARAHFEPFLSWPILRSQAHFLRHRPRAYAGALWAMVRANWGSANFFVGGLAVFPKAVHMARSMETGGVVHVHAHFANHPAAAAFVIHRLTGIPYSFTAHGADLQVDRHMLREKVAEADFVATISRYNREFILRECGERWSDKVVVVRCGIDTDAFRPRPEPETPRLEGGRLVIVCIGTMYEVKGHTYLLDACRLLGQRGVDYVCHLVGDGPDRPALDAQVERTGLGERVVFHGPKTRAEVIELLRQAEVVAVPSVPTSSGRREGIPVVLMEAMGSAVPVVASGISGIPELVEDGVSGLLVPPRDPVALADALELLHRDPHLGRCLGQAGRAKVLDQFDQQANAAALASRFPEGARR